MPNKKVKDESERRISKPITLPRKKWAIIDSMCSFWERSKQVEKMFDFFIDNNKGVK